MRSLIFALVVFFWSADALSQSRLPPGVRGPESGMATRSVSNYLMLERSLNDALQSGNRDAVLKMLGDNFAVRSPISQDELSTADWLKGASGEPTATSNVRDLTVREFDDLAIVSFILDRRHAGKTRPVGTTDFVVDVWRQSTGRLLMRYVTQSNRTAPIPSRPSGRE